MSQNNSKEIITQLLHFNDKIHKGNLIIEVNEKLKWQFYFRLGRLSWVTGGQNSKERLKRNINLYCPEVQRIELKHILLYHKNQREEEILVSLQRKNLIDRSKLTELMKNVAIEILFDIFQLDNDEKFVQNLSCERVPEEPEDKIALLLPLLDIKYIVQSAKKAWHEWQKSGLSHYSPNLYPVVKQPTLLRKHIITETQKQIISLADGTKTIRTLALKINSDIISVTRSIDPLIHSGRMEFFTFPHLRKVDVSNNHKNSNHQKLASLTLREKQPLVACVDDSEMICMTMKRIISNLNYRFMSIQEPIQVIATLLKNKPDFIFLDLLMPVINGYELCSQLRRTPSFRDTPIVILTGKNGLVDRMRAKVVGSTDFLSKPVEKNQVIGMLEKYLTVGDGNE